MKMRYLVLWGISSIILSLSSSVSASDNEIKFHGRVSIGGVGAVGAHISVLEGMPSDRAMNLPNFYLVASGITDANGNFAIETRHLGAVIIEVQGLRCKWHSKRVTVNRKLLTTSKLVEVNVMLYPDKHCSEDN